VKHGNAEGKPAIGLNWQMQSRQEVAGSQLTTNDAKGAGPCHRRPSHLPATRD